jgi:hypothetical protein
MLPVLPVIFDGNAGQKNKAAAMRKSSDSAPHFGLRAALRRSSKVLTGR